MMTTIDPKTVVEIITATTALVAVFVGPLLTSRYAHKKSVSEMREKWVTELREALAEFTSLSEDYCLHLFQVRIDPKLREQFKAVVAAEAKIKLLLTEQGLHRHLIVAVSDIVTLLQDETIQSPEKIRKFEKLKPIAISAGQQVLKEAWSQVTS
jgi:hypothetical protein